MEIVNNIYKIVRILNAYKVLAMPTDTVYGLIMKATDANESVIKNIKSRPENKQLPMVVGNLNDLYSLIEIPDKYKDKIGRYLPGPLTVVGKAKINYGHPTIAVRIPESTVMLNAVKQVGPCWLTSANISGEDPCLTSDQVKEKLQGRIEYVVPGKCVIGKPSTIVSFVNGQEEIIRRGSLDYPIDKIN